MKWLAATLALLASTSALVGWIYLRDRDPNAWHAARPQLAQGDAEAVLLGLQGWHCKSGCAVEQVRPGPDGLWFARLNIRWQPRCVEIDLGDFGIRQAGGFWGVRYVDCWPSASRSIQAG
jgi:hypothetical protein